MKIRVLGVPFNCDGTPPEKENPAQALRKAGLLAMLQASGNEVDDLGDLSVPPAEGIRDLVSRILNFSAWHNLTGKLANKLYDVIDGDTFTLVLGGDCSILTGIFSALSWWDSRVGLIFVDAHADFLTPETSSTGQPADMELAVITGRGPQAVANWGSHSPIVNDDDVVAFGLRQPDLLRHSRIKVYGRETMLQMGIKQLVDAGLHKFKQEHIPVWLHFDVDVLDPDSMPALHPIPGGLSFSETQALLRQTIASGLVLGMSVTCYHPRLDSDGKAGSRLTALIAGCFSNTPQCN